jgi:hypothetical protein
VTGLMTPFIEETPMMFLHKLTDWLRKHPEVKTPRSRSSARLRLEELEDRLVPAPITTGTYTNATVQITPGFTVTETVTAKVTPFQGFDTTTGQITSIPTGAAAPSSGTVLFNLNGLMKSATLDSNGQATATFQVPLLAFLTSQTLMASYQGTTDTSGDIWHGSTFLAPLYKNFDNLLASGTLTFNQLTPQQVYAQDISAFQNSSGIPTTLDPYYTAQGEADTLATSIGPVAFNYVDPGTIDTITALGMQFPGSLAIQLNAYAGIPASSNQK